MQTRKQLEQELISLWDLPIINGEIDVNWFIGKEFILNEIVSTCTSINKTDRSTVFISEIGRCSLRRAIFKLFNPITQDINDVPVYTFLKKKYFLSESEFKSRYYKTEEYRNKVKKTMVERYGVEHQIYSKKIRDKINSTMLTRYGVEWFLKRGDHYQTIEKILIEKYGYDNCFKNEEFHAHTVKKRLGNPINIEKREFFKNKRIQDKLLRPVKRCNVSKFELAAINWMLCNYNFKKPIFFSINDDSQQCIIKGNKISKKYYKVDFYDPELNVIIEFLGDYWHANPDIYHPDDIINYSFAKISASEIWERDECRKKEIISQTGCTFIEIWEKDFKLNKPKIYEQLNTFFTNKKNIETNN